MNKNKYARMLRSIAATGGAFVINLLIQLILTPHITETVGGDAYGFVTLAKNFAEYAFIITTALNSFAARFIVVAYHEGNKKEANRFFASTFYGNIIIVSLLVVIAGIMIAFLEYILQIPTALVADVKILFAYVFANFWLVTTFSVFETSAYIVDKLDMYGIIKGLSYLTEAVVLFFMYLILPPKASYIGIGLIAATIVMILGNRYIWKKNTPDLQLRVSDFSFDAVKRLVVNGIWSSVNMLGETLNNGLDLLISDLMLTPVEMGNVAFAKTLHTMSNGMFMVINQSFQPMFLKSYAAEDKKTLLSELKLSMKISALVANIAFAGIAALGLCFFRLWIPTQNTHEIYILTLINFLTLIPGGSMQPLFYVYTLTTKKKFPCFVTIAGGLCNVLGMIVLIRYTSLGVYAVVWTTAVVMMIINFITNPLYIAHVLKLPALSFYPEIIRNVISCGLMTVVFMLITKLCAPTSWASFICCAIVDAAIGSMIHGFVSFNKCERQQLFNRVIQKMHRRHN